MFPLLLPFQLMSFSPKVFSLYSITFLLHTIAQVYFFFHFK